MMFEMRAALHRPPQLQEKCLFTILPAHSHMRPRLQELSNTATLLSRNMPVLSVCSHRVPSYYSWHSVYVDGDGEALPQGTEQTHMHINIYLARDAREHY